MSSPQSTDLELATRLHNWGTADWIRRITGRDQLLAISADCVHALDEIQRQGTEIEQLKLDLAQQALNGQTVMEQQKEIQRLTIRLAECELSLNAYDRGGVAEYWIRHAHEGRAVPDVSGEVSK
jgi:hypothetical protein